MNFSKSASVLSSTEAGPACFFRKLTIPSSKKSSFRYNFIYFLELGQQVWGEYLHSWDHHRDQIPLHLWRSSRLGSRWRHICCMCCCWQCSRPKWEGKKRLNEALRRILKRERLKWRGLCKTLASGTMPFKRVAAASYSGASRLQWPHLKGKDMRVANKRHLSFKL